MLHTLIPLDSSDFSREALRIACKLQDPEQHRITLLQVVPLPAGYSTPLPAIMLDAWLTKGEDKVKEAVKNYANQNLLEFEAAVTRELEADTACLKELGFEVNLAIEFGTPAKQIMSFAEEHNIDMIIMATHGRKGLSRGILGSVSEEVVRSGHIPVLLVRPENP